MCLLSINNYVADGLVILIIIVIVIVIVVAVVVASNRVTVDGGRSLFDRPTPQSQTMSG